MLEGVADNVTIVNAETIASDRGITVTCKTTPEHGAFASVVSVEIVGAGTKRTAAGTLFGKNMPRLVRLDGYPTDAYMDGKIFVFTHRDIPGVIGNVGGVLAEEQVNIGQMAVGRCSSTKGGAAIGVLNLDSATSPAAIEKVLGFDGIESANLICLPEQGKVPDWLG